jgi:hypothetical protein
MQIGNYVAVDSIDRRVLGKIINIVTGEWYIEYTVRLYDINGIPFRTQIIDAYDSEYTISPVAKVQVKDLLSQFPNTTRMLYHE